MQNLMKQQECKVHKTLMKSVKVSASFGLFFIDHNFIKARDKWFPNIKKSILGGCMPNDESPNSFEQWICDDCLKAEADWKHTYKRNNKPRKKDFDDAD